MDIAGGREAIKRSGLSYFSDIFYTHPRANHVQPHPSVEPVKRPILLDLSEFSDSSEFSE
jgi:hypothetical protein